MKGQHCLLRSDCDEWETPQGLYNWLDRRFKFNLDPCASSNNAKCSQYFTKEDNALKLNWKTYGSSIFVNPPYSNIQKWIKKSYEEGRKGSNVVMLIPCRPDTIYWHKYIFPFASEIIFIRGRLKFNDYNNTATFPSVIIVFKKRRLYLKVSRVDKTTFKDPLQTTLALNTSGAKQDG